MPLNNPYKEKRDDLDGLTVFKGTDIPTSKLFDYINHDNKTLEDFLSDHPEIDKNIVTGYLNCIKGIFSP